MATRYKSKLEDERLVQDEGANHLERESAIKRLAFDQIYEMEPVFARLVYHPSPYIAGAAIYALLARWGKTQYLGDGIRILHSALEPVAREKAAFALYEFAQRGEASGSYKEQVIRELAHALTHDEDFGVHEECYRGLLQLLAPERGLTNFPTYFNRARDVDWELLKPYLDQQPT